MSRTREQAGPSKSSGSAGSAEEKEKDDRMFECNICLDTAKDAVVSMCGHLFCWPCLHQWLETRPARQVCPVCKAAISKDKVIPLYGRGATKHEDPRYNLFCLLKLKIVINFSFILHVIIILIIFNMYKKCLAKFILFCINTYINIKIGNNRSKIN
ncbi:hypothetical protein ACFW04_012260 [Cataglyphis niger]